MLHATRRRLGGRFLLLRCTFCEYFTGASFATPSILIARKPGGLFLIPSGASNQYTMIVNVAKKQRNAIPPVKGFFW